MSNKIFLEYKAEFGHPNNLFPVEMYFIQIRYESLEHNNQPIVSDFDVTEIKPNYLNKIGYYGKEHFLPTGPMSLMFNKEKFF